MVFLRVLTLFTLISLVDKAGSADIRGSNRDVRMSEEDAGKGQRELQPIKVGLLDMITVPINSLSTCNVLHERVGLMSVNIFERSQYNVLRLGDVSFSEKFKGQRLKPQQQGQIGFQDRLAGRPSTPLRLKPNDIDRENVYVTENCIKNKRGRRTCGVQIMGRTTSGFKGVGTVAALFKKPMSVVTIHMKTIEGTTTQMGTNGAIDGTLTFYTAKGRRLGSISLNVRGTTVYEFSRFQGDIKGFTMEPKGDKMNWHQLAIQGLCYSELQE